VVIATMLGLFIAAFAIHQFDSAFVRRLAAGLPSDAALAVRVVAGALPIVVVLTVGTAILLPLLLPPAFLFAWLAARGMTRRVEELVAVESMAKARRDLFARVSHELKNPLAALRAAVDGVRARGSRLPEVDVLDAGVARLSRLVGDLAELARAEVGPLALTIEDVDVRRSTLSIVNAERLRADALQIALLAEIGEAEPLLRRLDRVRFEQILANLLQNALRHVDAGGIVRVRVFTEGGRAIVVVEDTGSGIDEAAMPRIFEPGFSKDGGLGLGLAVARELAERMGGTLAVDAATGGGARFSLSF
jgi:signal transduction histidine kinase